MTALLITTAVFSQSAFLRSNVGYPWADGGFNADDDYTAAMDANFGATNWSDLRFESADVADLLANHSFIYLEGGDDNANELEAFLVANLTDIEAWVNNGGRLFINSAPNEGNGMSYGFGGVELIYNGGSADVESVVGFDNNHPIFTNVTATQYTGNDFAHALVCPPGMTGILHETGDNTSVVLASGNYGTGFAMFGGMTNSFYWSPAGDGFQLFVDMIGFAAGTLGDVCEPAITITCPADADLECGADVSADALGFPTVSGNECVGDIDISFMDTEMGDCPQIIARTWIATDGETTEMCTQTITVTDTQAPVITFFPEDVVLECAPEFLTQAGLNEYLAQTVEDPIIDDCTDISVSVEWIFADDIACPVVGECYKVATFTDECGNSTTETLTVTILDTTGPEFDAPEEITVSCLEEVPAPANLSALDACSQMDIPADQFSTNNGELVSTCDLSTAFGVGDDWSLWLPTLAQDGEVASSNFVFDENGGTFDQFIDGTAHLYGTTYNLDNPAEVFVLDMWFQNKADWAAWSGLGRSYKDDLGCAQPDLFEDWMYYELVDGFSTASGQGDLDGDVLYFNHMPASYYYGFQIGMGANNKNCGFGLSGWFTYNGFVDGTAVEGHGDVNVDATCEPVLEQDCPHNTEFTYFYRAEDDCGNATIFSQTIIVNDEIAPEFINFPEDIEVNCEDYPVEIPVLEATDNCVGDVVVLGPVDEMIPGDCPNRFVIERSWSAIDICGNRLDQTWTITVIDESAPEFSGLPEANVTVECDMVPEAADVSVSDNCSAEENIDFSYQELITDGECPGNYSIERTWTAIDECGNENIFVQNITVEDTTAPLFDEFPASIFISCEEVDAYTITATDNCGEATVTILEEQLNSGGCMGVLYRLYQATDECGNVSAVEQFITITDNVAPELVNIPENDTLECSDVALMGDGNYFTDAGVTGVDNCMLDVEVTYSEEVQDDGDDCPESFIIVRTWTAIDYCDNMTVEQSTVTVVDTTSPEWVSFPADETISCDEELPALVMPVAEDNCDNLVDVEVTVEENDGECDGEREVRRIFRGYDNCGNEVLGVQTITIIDETAPEFTSVPATASYECNTEIPVVLAEAEDNCSDVTVTFADGASTPGDCPAEYSFVRTFTATDDCGNSATAEQLIIVEDTTAPVFADYDVEINMPCDNIVATNLEVNDNCSTVEVGFEDTPVSGGCIGRIIRDWTATDACGNVATAQQIITLTDEVAPEFSAFPVDMTEECDNIPAVSQMVDADDNCDDNVLVEYLGEEILPGDCPQSYTIVRTWRATDSCENMTERSQTITIQDTTAPELSVPAGYEISCDETLLLEDASASDNCGDVTITVGEETIPGACPQAYTLIRTFTAMDECGNSTSGTQTIEVYDNEAPEFTSVPATAMYECSEEIPVILAEAEDNCGD
ncbi:MAG: hypothetical protein AAF193_00590, partial [Bacteroidota bacterium]